VLNPQKVDVFERKVENVAIKLSDMEELNIN
jgi:hypothetical protein